MLNWKSVESKSRNVLQDYCDKYNDGISDYTFTSLLCWSIGMNIQYVIEKDTVILKYTIYNGDEYALMPLGKNICEAIKLLDEDYKLNKKKLKFDIISEKTANIICEGFGDKYNVGLIEENFDYIYECNDFVNMTGHKNSTNRYKLKKLFRDHRIEYVKYEQKYEDVLMNFHRRWISNRGTKSKKYKFFEESEYIGMRSVMRECERCERTKGGILFVDGKISGFGFGDRLNNDTAVLHNVKITHEYNGSMLAFMKLFIENEFSSYKYINFEDDMGLEGLRNSKMRMHPCCFVNKYGENDL